jgi:hypothetical protein
MGCPDTGYADCETTVRTKLRCGYCWYDDDDDDDDSTDTMAECVQARYGYGDDHDYSNYDSSTEPNVSSMDGMTFVYSNCDSCEAHTSSWMRNQNKKMLRTLHTAFLVLGMAIGLTATIAVLIVYRVLFLWTVMRIDESAVSRSGFLT